MLSWLYALFVEPSAHIREPDQRRQAQLLTVIMVFLIPQAILGVLWVVLTRAGSPFQNTFFQIALVMIAAFVAVYILSRTRFFAYGAAIAVASLTVLTFTAALLVNPSLVFVGELLVWLLLAVVLSGIFFPLRWSIALMVIHLAGLLVLPLASSLISFRLIVVPTIFVEILSTLVVVWSNHRNLVEADRRTILAESEARYRTLLETVFDGIILHDNTQILEGNPGFAAMFGYDLRELSGMPLTRLAIHGTGNKRIARAIAIGDQPIHELRAVRADGAILDVEVVGKSQSYYGRTVQMAAVRDISERKRAENAEYRRRVLAEALRDTASALNSTLDLDEVFERILSNLNLVVPHNAAAVITVEGDRGYITRIRGQGVDAASRDSSPALIISEIPFLREIQRTAKPVSVENTGETADWVDLFRTDWQGSCLGVPILSDDNVIGFLVLESQQPDFFSGMQADDLRTFADQAAVAIENARLYQALHARSQSLEEAVQERTQELSRITDQLAVILNNSPETILLLNPEGLVLTANRALETSIGYTLEEARSLSLPALVSATSRKGVRNALTRALQTQEAQHIEIMVERKGREHFDADLILAPIVERGRVINLVASFHDITSLKQVERMKDAFISNVSHELRTPITSLKLYHDLLSRKPEEHERLTSRIGREINRLQGIVEDLLQLSRLEQNTASIDIQRVWLPDLAHEYAADRTMLAESRRLSMLVEAEPDTPPVPADMSLIGQVISILLTNAINYTPAEGQITIRVYGKDCDGRHGAALCVEDSGPGIAADDMPYLFDRFYRGKTGQNSGMPGTGLGLSIARQIVERHGGIITAAHGKGGQGARFEIWLPETPA
ncbi:MAG: PAS domain S-box protein [Anaerolineae bacterium]|nr:PAS domain S-box protein [Anaerolineae bacterium]